MMKAVIILCLVTSCLGSAVLRRPRLDGRIVGGSTADIKDSPYQLSLQTEGNHYCGASIISAEWALTAGHCVDGGLPSWISVRAGSSNRACGGSIHQVAQIISHPKFDRNTLDYDFALIRVATPFSFGSNVAAVGLPSRNEDVSPGTSAIVTGWGLTSEGDGWNATILQQVTVPIVSYSECNADYENYDGGITERMICAGYTAGGKDACQGDSGGPLVANGKLQGVVSWGYGCARPNYPGVYARVASVRDWIKTSSGV
ncbi:trypsin-1 isoform X1 [Anabrus simplex]|uniref:trypsin-1 isoform X1 n=1 Tax=Anabrus simplex TaxID=316456 RepID=UPI0035A321A6